MTTTYREIRESCLLIKEFIQIVKYIRKMKNTTLSKFTNSNNNAMNDHFYKTLFLEKCLMYSTKQRIYMYTLFTQECKDLLPVTEWLSCRGRSGISCIILYLLAYTVFPFWSSTFQPRLEDQFLFSLFSIMKKKKA